MSRSILLALPLLGLGACFGFTAPHTRIFPVRTDEQTVTRLHDQVAYLLSLSDPAVIDLVPTAFGMAAFGRELLPDGGYTWTNYRLAWMATTMAHNTVVANGRESGLDRDHRQQRLVAWHADPPHLQLAAAENDAAYPGTVQTYRRTLAVVGQDSRDAYLIDLFEIADGTTWPFTITTIEATANGSRITVREDPAYDQEEEQVHLRAFPKHSIAGASVTYSLPAVARHPTIK